MIIRSPYRCTALLTAALFAAAACHDADISRPMVPSSSVHAQGGVGGGRPLGAQGKGNAFGPQGGATPVTCSAHNVVVSSGVFGPAGGTLLFGDDRLVIPGGALHDTVTITATTSGDSNSVVDFQPQGLHFYKPAGLVLSSDGCTIPPDGMPSVVYLGPAGEVLETIEAVYSPQWKTVAAPIEHFSGYAIAF